MDIARPDLLENKKRRRLAWGAVAALAIVLLTVGVSRLKPAAPTVERATVVIDKVERGEMVREVRGLGTLVPEEIRWIPAVTDARVERLVVATPGQCNTCHERGMNWLGVQDTRPSDHNGNEAAPNSCDRSGCHNTRTFDR